MTDLSACTYVIPFVVPYELNVLLSFRNACKVWLFIERHVLKLSKDSMLLVELPTEEDPCMHSCSLGGESTRQNLFKRLYASVDKGWSGRLAAATTTVAAWFSLIFFACFPFQLLLLPPFPFCAFRKCFTKGSQVQSPLVLLFGGSCLLTYAIHPAMAAAYAALYLIL